MKGPSSVAAAEAEQRVVREKLKSLLARHGAASPDELRRLRQHRIALEEVSRDLRAERAALGLKEAAPLSFEKPYRGFFHQEITSFPGQLTIGWKDGVLTVQEEYPYRGH